MPYNKDLQILKIKNRFKELQLLQDGWLNGEGKSYNYNELTNFELLFLKHYNFKKLPIPNIYPMVNGDIQLEWSLQDYNIEIEIDLKLLIGIYESINCSNNIEVGDTFDLNDENDWNKLNLTIHIYCD